MSIQSHIAELEQRHTSLEHQIEEALQHPSTDDLILTDLKRKKLHVKDTLMRLKSEAAASVH
ncbi:MAG: YdcH family protein [Xanthobacteraceae bacterium]